MTTIKRIRRWKNAKENDHIFFILQSYYKSTSDATRMHHLLLVPFSI